MDPRPCLPCHLCTIDSSDSHLLSISRTILTCFVLLFKVEIPYTLHNALKVYGQFFQMHKVPETNVFIIIKQGHYTGGTQCFCGVDQVHLESFHPPRINERSDLSGHCSVRVVICMVVCQLRYKPLPSLPPENEITPDLAWFTFGLKLNFKIKKKNGLRITYYYLLLCLPVSQNLSFSFYLANYPFF